MKDFLLNLQFIVAFTVAVLAIVFVLIDIVDVVQGFSDTVPDMRMALRLWMEFILVALCNFWMVWSGLMKVRECGHPGGVDPEVCGCQDVKRWLVSWRVIREE